METTGQQALLCTGIRPGDEYIFAVIAQKSAQVSDAATISHTVRPLPPRSIEATADVGRLLFCVRVELQPPSLSYTEKCALSILAEESGEHIERIVNATAEETTTNASLRSTRLRWKFVIIEAETPVFNYFALVKLCFLVVYCGLP